MTNERWIEATEPGGATIRVNMSLIFAIDEDFIGTTKLTRLHPIAGEPIKVTEAPEHFMELGHSRVDAMPG